MGRQANRRRWWQIQRHIRWGNTMSDTVNKQKLYVPAVAPLYERLGPLSYTLIRVALGLILIPHGFSKLFLTDAIPASRNFVNFGWAYPLAWAYFIGALEFF